MKKISVLFLLMITFSSSAFAQDVPEHGIFILNIQISDKDTPVNIIMID